MASIGIIAKTLGVSVETLRYYEKQGLIDTPARKNNGYRNYSDSAIKRIRFILNAKQAGLSLKEIRELLSLSAETSSHCVKSLIDNKLIQIDQKINSLISIKQTLERLSSSCDGKDTIKDCPIMDAFNQEN